MKTRANETSATTLNIANGNPTLVEVEMPVLGTTVVLPVVLFSVVNQLAATGWNLPAMANFSTSKTTLDSSLFASKAGKFDGHWKTTPGTESRRTT